MRDDRDVGDPGIALTWSRLATLCTLPLIVGGRQTMVGSALGTSRSSANCFCPVTAARASMRRCGVPTSENREGDFRRATTALLRLAAAFFVSEP